MSEAAIDRNEWLRQTRRTEKWKKRAALLILLHWVLWVGGCVGMCVLYRPGERIGTGGGIILAVMLASLAASLPATLVLCSWRPELDLDCTRCGRSFTSADLPALRQSGRCPDCGQPIAREVLEGLD